MLVALVRAWVARFETKIIRGAGCHIWSGALQSSGHGSMGIGGTSVLAHRLAWELERGPIPDGLTVDHTCCEKRCQNVAHMELVSMEENLSRAGERMTTCRRGHELSGSNLYVYRSTGKRGCRTCRAMNRRAASLEEVRHA